MQDMPVFLISLPELLNVNPGSSRYFFRRLFLQIFCKTAANRERVVDDQGGDDKIMRGSP